MGDRNLAEKFTSLHLSSLLRLGRHIPYSSRDPRLGAHGKCLRKPAPIDGGSHDFVGVQQFGAGFSSAVLTWTGFFFANFPNEQNGTKIHRQREFHAPHGKTPAFQVIYWSPNSDAETSIPQPPFSRAKGNPHNFSLAAICLVLTQWGLSQNDVYPQHSPIFMRKTRRFKPANSKCPQVWDKPIFDTLQETWPNL